MIGFEGLAESEAPTEEEEDAPICGPVNVFPANKAKGGEDDEGGDGDDGVEAFDASEVRGELSGKEPGDDSEKEDHKGEDAGEIPAEGVIVDGEWREFFQRKNEGEGEEADRHEDNEREGSRSLSQEAKLMSRASVAAMALGAVPIMEPMPPMEAAIRQTEEKEAGGTVGGLWVFFFTNLGPIMPRATGQEHGRGGGVGDPHGDNGAAAAQRASAERMK